MSCSLRPCVNALIRASASSNLSYLSGTGEIFFSMCVGVGYSLPILRVIYLDDSDTHYTRRFLRKMSLVANERILG